MNQHLSPECVDTLATYLDLDHADTDELVEAGEENGVDGLRWRGANVLLDVSSVHECVVWGKGQ